MTGGTGPVDCLLDCGYLRFGNQCAHLARSPAVSATHVRGEALVVTVHGTAKSLALEGGDRDFRDFLRDHYGDDQFDRHLAGEPYYRIDPDRLYAADMTVHGS